MLIHQVEEITAGNGNIFMPAEITMEIPLAISIALYGLIDILLFWEN